MRDDEETYYDVLEVPESADARQIRAAHLKLVKRYHPDGIPEHRTWFREQANEQMILINQAREVLGDPKKKRRYDELLRQHRAASQPPPVQAASPNPPPRPPPRSAQPAPPRSAKPKQSTRSKAPPSKQPPPPKKPPLAKANAGRRRVRIGVLIIVSLLVVLAGRSYFRFGVKMETPSSSLSKPEQLQGSTAGSDEGVIRSFENGDYPEDVIAEVLARYGMKAGYKYVSEKTTGDSFLDQVRTSKGTYTNKIAEGMHYVFSYTERSIAHMERLETEEMRRRGFDSSTHRKVEVVFGIVSTTGGYDLGVIRLKVAPVGLNPNP